MTRCQPTQHLLAFRCDLQDRAAFVRGIVSSCDQTFALGPIDEFDSAVMLQPEAFGRVGNGDSLPLRGSRNLQKKLMLLWVQSRFLSRALAEMQETTELKTKFGQGNEKRV
jgi:hypothetical protein